MYRNCKPSMKLLRAGFQNYSQPLKILQNKKYVGSKRSNHGGRDSREASDLRRLSSASDNPHFTTPSEKFGNLSVEPNNKLGQRVVNWIGQVGRKAFESKSKDNPTISSVEQPDNYRDLSRSSNDSCKPFITTPSRKLSAELNIRYSKQNGMKQFDLKAKFQVKS